MTPSRMSNPFRRGGGAAPSAAPGDAPASGESSRPAAPSRKGLSEIAADLFSLVLTLKAGTDLGDVTEVRKRILALLDRFLSEGRKNDHPAQAVEDARFALVALLDEAVLNSQWKAGQGAWRILSLQQELYKINTAGDEFFKRLEALRQNAGENAEVLEVYFDAIALGFQGRFRLFGREKLDALTADVARELAKGRRWSMADISPRWRRPDDFSEVVGEGIPIWATALFFIPGAFLLILLFGVLARATAGRTASDLQELLTRIGS